jgi:single-strand DNA-binding protein
MSLRRASQFTREWVEPPVFSSCRHPVRRQGSLRDAATVGRGFADAQLRSARPPGSVSSLGLRRPLDPGGVPAGAAVQTGGIRPTGTRNKEKAMSNANTVTLAGNLTRDPEIRYTRDGNANSSFGLAVNRRWQARGSDEWEEATSFFDVVCWRDLAENVALSLVKGSRVIVTGRLEQRTWENDEGERRSRVELAADDVGPSLRFATAEVTRTERLASQLPDSAAED